MKNFFIYKILNMLNNKSYVGQHSTDNVDDDYLGSGLLILRAIKKYGKEHFKREIIEKCKTFDELNDKECFWIKELNTIYPNGYNLRAGGNNSLLTDDIKLKISSSRKGQCKGNLNPNFNGKITRRKEIKEKISLKNKLNWQNNPILKIKCSRKGKSMPIAFGPKHSEDVKGEKNGRYLKVDENIVNQIIQLYTIQKLGLVEIGNKFNLSYYKIKRILINNNIEIIRYQY